MLVYKVSERFDFPKKRKCVKCGSELGIEHSDIILIEKTQTHPKYGARDYKVKAFECIICKEIQQLD